VPPDDALLELLALPAGGAFSWELAALEGVVFLCELTLPADLLAADLAMDVDPKSWMDAANSNSSYNQT
jgi:hypothetical protein